MSNQAKWIAFMLVSAWVVIPAALLAVLWQLALAGWEMGKDFFDLTVTYLDKEPRK